MTPESMRGATLRELVEAYANKSQSLALINATTMTAAQLRPFKVAIVLAVEPPSFDALLEFVAAGGSVIVTGGACRSNPQMQAALGIVVTGPDIATTNLNVTVRTDAFADAWNVRVPPPSSAPVTLTPVTLDTSKGANRASGLANVTVGATTHLWLVARRHGAQYGMLVYVAVSEPSAVGTSMRFVFSSTGLGTYLSRTVSVGEKDQLEPIQVDDETSQVAVDHLPPSIGLPDRYRITILQTDSSRWKAKPGYPTKSLCVDLLTRWFGLRSPQVQAANVGAGIEVAVSKTYGSTRVCITQAAPAAPLASSIAGTVVPVAHPSSFCCALPACSDNAYSFVANSSQQQCAAECAKLGCPCFDYIVKIAHRGFSNCRVLPAGASFAVHHSPSGETAYTTVPVPPPPPPPTVVHVHQFCKTVPHADVFALVNNSTQQECAASCTKFSCPCFDWSSKVWAQGQCRIVGHGAAFVLGHSCAASDCETAYTRVPVPAPSPSPPPPPNLQLPVSFELVSEPAEDPMGCKSDSDCELNGICSKNTVVPRRCECDTGWFGPTCGRLDLLPAHEAGIWPTHRGQTMPFGAAPAPLADSRRNQAMSWGGSVVQDRVTKRYHGFFDTGCFDPSNMAHVQGYQLAHAVSDSLDKPFELHSLPVLVGPGPAEAKAAFNPHAGFFPDGKGGGDYVLFYSSIGGLGGMTGKKAESLSVCSGAEVPGGRATQQPNASYVRPSGACDINAKRGGMSALCALYAKSLDGPWAIKPVFAIPGPAAGGCNVVATPLRNGSVLFASGICGAKSTRGVPSANEERLGLSIGTAWDGVYHPVPAFPGILWPELNEPSEDQTLWEDKRGGLHILLHGNQWAGEWPSLHAYSRDGSPGTWQLSKRTDGYVPYSANVSWAEGGWTNFFRRERPELHLNQQGEPSFLLSGVMFGRDYPTRQFSFTILQRVRGGNATSLKSDGGDDGPALY